MPRRMPLSVGTKLAEAEHGVLLSRATSHGMKISEYLRFLILSDLDFVNEDRVLRTVEAEHIRLMILAAQLGKKLDDALVHELRSQAITGARTLVEQTLRLVRQV